MTMKFRIVKAAVKDWLVLKANNRYQVVGSQRQEKSAVESSGTNRLVEVFFKTENFDKSNSSQGGPFTGGIQLAIELTVSAPAQADLAILNNPGSTAEQIEAALLGMKEATDIADESFDELADIIFQTLMTAENLDFQLPPGEATNRWISSINKNDPNPRGELVVLTGSLDISCKVSDDVGGLDTSPLESNDITIDINNDTVQNTGVDIKYT